jgi:hypothetical protein
MSLYDIDDLHITDFNKDAGRVLVFLYNCFPRKIELYVEDISGPDTTDDYGLHSERHLACMSTIVWLAEEGLIRYESLVRQDSFDHAVLTKKSYVLLSNIIHNEHSEENAENEEGLPESVIENRHTRIAGIKKALKSGSSERLKKAICDFIFESEKAPDNKHYLDNNF